MEKVLVDLKPRTTPAHGVTTVDPEYFAIQCRIGYASTPGDVGGRSRVDTAFGLGIPQARHVDFAMTSISMETEWRVGGIDIVANPSEWRRADLAAVPPDIEDVFAELQAGYDLDGRAALDIQESISWDPGASALQIDFADTVDPLSWGRLADNVLIGVGPDRSLHCLRLLGVPLDPETDWEGLAAPV